MLMTLAASFIPGTSIYLFFQILVHDSLGGVYADTVFELATSFLFPGERNRTHTSAGFVFVGDNAPSGDYTLEPVNISLLVLSHIRKKPPSLI
jgi:hypothetical protein